MSIRYLTPASLGAMSLRTRPLLIGLIRTCYTIQLFHQYLVKLLFAAFGAFLAPLLVVLAVHKLPFCMGIDMGNDPLSQLECAIKTALTCEYVTKIIVYLLY